MGYDVALVSEKLNRWKSFMTSYSLPAWEEIPGIGLYMDQVVSVLSQYLDFLPRTDKGETVVTPNAINNYVRLKAMPAPEKKKYGRIHLAYLIMICTLKQSLSISYIQKLLPADLSGEEMRQIYTDYIQRHKKTTQYFARQADEFKEALWNEESVDQAVRELVYTSAITSSFARLLAEKLLDLNGREIEAEESAE